MPLESIVKKGHVIPLTDAEPNSLITADIILASGIDFDDSVIPVLYTGWTDRAWGSQRFWDDMICLDESVSHLMLVMSQIRKIGVLVKDLDKGLIDFPYLRDDHVVYLCWQLGEDSVDYWHEIDTGFSGRQPLSESDL